MLVLPVHFVVFLTCARPFCSFLLDAQSPDVQLLLKMMTQRENEKTLNENNIEQRYH